MELLDALLASGAREVLQQDGADATALMLVDDREGHLGSGGDIRRGSVDAVITTDADHAFLAALAEHRSEADMLHEVDLGEVGALLLAEPALHAEHPVTASERGRPRSCMPGLDGGALTVSDFQRILVPTDFGESSSRAVDVAVALAEKLDASLTLLHTYEIPSYAYAGLAFAPDDYLSAVADAAKRDLEAVLAKVRARMPRVKALLRQGEPRAEILAAIHETNADLVVMGTHGRHGLSRAFLGSVAEATVRSSSVPVLTTRAASGAPYA